MENYEELARLFSIMSDPVRLRIVTTLLQVESICAGDLAQSAEVTAANLSNHLRLMRLQNIVRAKKQGKQIIYSLANQESLRNLLDQGRKLITSF